MLVIISGPSGVGKDTIIEALQRRGHLPEYHYVVTCTTRPRRVNEIDGVSYNFVTVAEFLALRDAGELLEANEVHGNWYGTPRAGVRDALARGQHAILKIDVQGAEVVKRKVPDALLIFVCRRRWRLSSSTSRLDAPSRPSSSRSASATPRSSWPARTTTTTWSSTREGRVDATAENIEQIISRKSGAGRATVTV